MTQPPKGLTTDHAKQRLAELGPNRITLTREVSFWRILREEITEPMILLLLAVAAAYFLFARPEEALVVLFIILGILFVEVWTEFRAKRAVSALSRRVEPQTLVFRDGQLQSIPVEHVVPGDLLMLREGSHVPADAVLLRADYLAVDESPLTGESAPVEKRTGEPVFKGTTVTRGEALVEVTATGLHTQLGQIAGLIAEVKPPKTPLQLSMKSLSGVLAGIALGFAVLIPLLMVLLGHAGWRQAVLTGLSLAFATIPEELPILITVVLGLGALRLAGHRAQARGLRPIETLGHITAVVTDKTGTLTENRLRLVGYWPAGSTEPRVFEPGTEDELLKGAYLSLGIRPENAVLIDPIEKALGEGLAYLGNPVATERTLERIPFTRERGWSGARGSDGKIYVKGAPEFVLARDEALSESEKAATLDQVRALAASGYRVLAVAEEKEEDGAWTYRGLLVLEDPLRPEAREAVQAVQRAGVKVYIATGDPAIAQSIAHQVGLPAERVLTGMELDRMSDRELKRELTSTFVFARILPAHKLRLVKALQELGHVVAMTGDGINDTPALKAAHVGIAMGLSGTDAAREAASLVLTDDRFATLTTAIHEGRGLFANLQKAVRYYLAVKVALILAMLVPALFGLLPPLAPAMIVLLELFMDLAASTAFVIEPPERPLMERPPRDPNTPFLDAQMQRGIFVGGLLLAGVVLASGYAGAQMGGEVLYRTGAFTAWMLGHATLAFVFRTWKASLRTLGWFSNRVMNLWALAVLATTLLVQHLPWLRAAFGTGPLPLQLWGLVVGLVLAVVGLGGAGVRAGAKG